MPFTTERFSFTALQVIAYLPEDMETVFLENDGFNLNTLVTHLVGGAERCQVLDASYRDIVHHVEALQTVLLKMMPSTPEDMMENIPVAANSADMNMSASSESSEDTQTVATVSDENSVVNFQQFDQALTRDALSRTLSEIQRVTSQYLQTFIAGVVAIVQMTEVDHLSVNGYKILHSFIEKIEVAGYALDQVLLNLEDVITDPNITQSSRLAVLTALTALRAQLRLKESLIFMLNTKVTIVDKHNPLTAMSSVVSALNPFSEVTLASLSPLASRLEKSKPQALERLDNLVRHELSITDGLSNPDRDVVYRHISTLLQKAFDRNDPDFIQLHFYALAYITPEQAAFRKPTKEGQLGKSVINKLYDNIIAFLNKMKDKTLVIDELAVSSTYYKLSIIDNTHATRYAQSLYYITKTLHLMDSVSGVERLNGSLLANTLLVLMVQLDILKTTSPNAFDDELSGQINTLKTSIINKLTQKIAGISNRTPESGFKILFNYKPEKAIIYEVMVDIVKQRICHPYLLALLFILNHRQDEKVYVLRRDGNTQPFDVELFRAPSEQDTSARGIKVYSPLFARAMWVLWERLTGTQETVIPVNQVLSTLFSELTKDAVLTGMITQLWQSSDFINVLRNYLQSQLSPAYVVFERKSVTDIARATDTQGHKTSQVEVRDLPSSRLHVVSNRRADLYAPAGIEVLCATIDQQAEFTQALKAYQAAMIAYKAFRQKFQHDDAALILETERNRFNRIYQNQSNTSSSQPKRRGAATKEVNPPVLENAVKRHFENMLNETMGSDAQHAQMSSSSSDLSVSVDSKAVLLGQIEALFKHFLVLQRYQQDLVVPSGEEGWFTKPGKAGSGRVKTPSELSNRYFAQIKQIRAATAAFDQIAHTLIHSILASSAAMVNESNQHIPVSSSNTYGQTVGDDSSAFSTPQFSPSRSRWLASGQGNDTGPALVQQLSGLTSTVNQELQNLAFHRKQAGELIVEGEKEVIRRRTEQITQARQAFMSLRVSHKVQFQAWRAQLEYQYDDIPEMDPLTLVRVTQVTFERTYAVYQGASEGLSAEQTACILAALDYRNAIINLGKRYLEQLYSHAIGNLSEKDKRSWILSYDGSDMPQSLHLGVGLVVALRRGLPIHRESYEQAEALVANRVVLERLPGLHGLEDRYAAWEQQARERQAWARAALEASMEQEDASQEQDMLLQISGVGPVALTPASDSRLILQTYLAILIELQQPAPAFHRFDKSALQGVYKFILHSRDLSPEAEMDAVTLCAHTLDHSGSSSESSAYSEDSLKATAHDDHLAIITVLLQSTLEKMVPIVDRMPLDSSAFLSNPHSLSDDLSATSILPGPLPLNASSMSSSSVVAPKQRQGLQNRPPPLPRDSGSPEPHQPMQMPSFDYLEVGQHGSGDANDLFAESSPSVSTQPISLSTNRHGIHRHPSPARPESSSSSNTSTTASTERQADSTEIPDLPPLPLRNTQPGPSNSELHTAMVGQVPPPPPPPPPPAVPRLQQSSSSMSAKPVPRTQSMSEFFRTRNASCSDFVLPSSLGLGRAESPRSGDDNSAGNSGNGLVGHLSRRLAETRLAHGPDDPNDHKEGSGAWSSGEDSGENDSGEERGYIPG